MVDPDEMAVVTDENFVGPGRPGPAAQLLAGDPAAADQDLHGDRPRRGRGYGHGTCFGTGADDGRGGLRGWLPNQTQAYNRKMTDR
ncbi:hypothetical protein GCM10009630_54580 [Kribbella jejuensis]